MLVASRWWLAVRAVLSGFEGTDLASLAHLEYPQSADGILERGGFLRNPHSLPRASLQIFLLSISLEQAQIRLFVKIFAERGGFEPPKPFWSLHAFQACLFNHSSISPSSQLACKKKLALRVWLAAVAPLNSGSRSPR